MKSITEPLCSLYKLTVFNRINAAVLFSLLKCGRKLDATNNYCFNYGVNIFRINLTELTSFNFDYTAAALIRGEGGACSRKYALVS